MKILRITLSNIASLAGQHTVDFTREPLSSAGLYSISGDTGSGKSTLLDALCLALYGKTPRLTDSRESLEKINNDEKQLDPRTLLRRGTAEGLAEVAFLGVDGKPWTARWTVHRARKNVSGKLQDVHRTLFEGHIEPAGDGVIASGGGGKKTEVASAIQEKLGLTFEQFTRAVLLAQNEFAVFLKSHDKERAEILQALTGTGRFEEISKAVFERCKTERKQIDDFKAALNVTSVMDDESRQVKEKELEEVASRLKAFHAQHTQLQKENDWHSSLLAKDKEVDKVQAALSAAQQSLSDSASRKQQLKSTEQALRQAAPLFQNKKESQTAVEEHQKAADFAAKSKSEIQKEERLAVQATEKAAIQFKNAQAADKALQPKLIQAAQLSESIRNQTQTVEDVNKDLASAEQEHLKLGQQLEQLNSVIQDSLADQKRLNQQQEQLQVYEAFAESKDLWVERIQQAAEVESHIQSTEKELKELNKQLAEAKKQQDKAAKSFASEEQKLADAKQAVDVAEKQAQEFNREKLTDQRDAVQDRRELWSNFQHHLKAVHQAESDLKQCCEQLRSCQETIKQHDAQRSQLSDITIPAAVAERDSRQASLLTVQSAISDEAIRLRTQLQDGQPCCVCGNAQHPYLDHPPSSDETAVQTLKDGLAEAESTLNQHTNQLANLSAELTTAAKRTKELAAQEQQLKERIEGFFFEESDELEIQEALQLSPHLQLEKSEQQIRDADKHLLELKEQNKLAVETEKAAVSARKLSEKLQSKTAKAQVLLAGRNQEFSVADSDVRHAASRLKELNVERQNQQLHLQQLFETIPDSKQKFDSDPDAFKSSFAGSVNQLEQVAEQLTVAHQNFKQAQSKQEAIQPLADGANLRFLDHKKQADEAAAVLEKQNQKQSELLGGQSPEDAKKQSDQGLADADAAKKSCSETENKAKQLLAVQSQKEESARKLVQEAEQKLKEEAATFSNWIVEFNRENGLEVSESDVLEMLKRDDVWLKAESELLEALAADVQTKSGQLKTLQDQKQKLLKDRATDRTIEELATLIKSVTEELEETNKAKEVVQRDLAVDDAQKQKDATLRLQMEAQEKTASPWIKLNEVIGSSDGSSFRNVAQRHTLDILLQFANHQLALLSGRYRLERIKNSLNLMVVDQDMADERRSIHSLSGGESFLVSLALALGLASLTSNRLKIESLFIDEGFGSLDPNTLDLAMNALVQLESQGRKVGIISHVTAMTDAIPVQVKVTRGSNGASTVQVPDSGVPQIELKSSATP